MTQQEQIVAQIHQLNSFLLDEYRSEVLSQMNTAPGLGSAVDVVIRIIRQQREKLEKIRQLTE